jgi:hypothetical protein
MNFHEFLWCPLQDLHKLLKNELVEVLLGNMDSDMPFFQCQALHYLCRPEMLEDCSAHNFFAKYEVKKCTTRTKVSVIPFKNTATFHHPSYFEASNKYMQGVRQRDTTHVVMVSQ